ncbi:cell wall hydrolase [Streptomyces sp. CB02923]|nr:cell wall hydrolase [Streptomyces sp. CB02923]
MDPLSRLPAALRDVPYAGARHPGAAALPGSPPYDVPPYDVSAGANCQLYAYAVLRHFGREVPPLRSAELWADTAATARAEPPGPLDLVLFDAGEVPGRPAGYGAHVGVYLGPGQVLHLCKEAGRPAVWSYADFAERPRYARFLGAKRVRGAGVSR